MRAKYVIGETCLGSKLCQRDPKFANISKKIHKSLHFSGSVRFSSRFSLYFLGFSNVLENAELHCNSPKFCRFPPEHRNFRGTSIQKKYSCDPHTEPLVHCQLQRLHRQRQKRANGNANSRAVRGRQLRCQLVTRVTPAPGVSNKNQFMKRPKFLTKSLKRPPDQKLSSRIPGYRLDAAKRKALLRLVAF